MTATFWPAPPSSASCNFPDEMLRATKSFENFYLSRHSGRKLSWQPTLGNADVRIAFKNRKHDVNVPTMGLVVLLLFEEITRVLDYPSQVRGDHSMENILVTATMNEVRGRGRGSYIWGK